MSLKHLLTGIINGGFVLILGVDPLTVALSADSPGFVAVDQVIAKAAQEKPLERTAADCVQGKVRVADCSKEIEQADKPAALETSWMNRLVFPSGNKF